MMKISIEEHWGNLDTSKIIQKYLEEENFLTVDPDLMPSVQPKMGVDGFETHRLPEMDENEVVMQVISLGSPGIQAIENTQEAIELAKRLNDLQHEIINRNPTRFAGFAALPLQDPQAAADELERAVKQLGFKGAMVQGHSRGEYLDDEKFWCVWEQAAELEVPIYLHIRDSLKDQIKIYDGYPELLGPTWNWGVEAGTHAMRIICSGVFDAFPKASLILGHLGELLPYFLGRMDEGFILTGGKKKGKLKKMPSAYVKENILVTTSGLWQPEALLCAIGALGADRVLFAADYPFVDTKTAVELIEKTPLSEDVKKQIYYDNAKRILRL